MFKNLSELAYRKQSKEFAEKFNNLYQRNKYIEHVKREKNASVMYNILNATKNIGIFNQLLQEDKDFAFNVLDYSSSQITLFKTLFFKLNQHEGEYIEHIKREKNAGAIYGILSATKNIGIFGQLLQEDKDFAFNVLDYSSSQITLFKTLFFKLNQHKGKYIEHVERKKNAGAMYSILNAMKDAKIFGQLLQEDKDFAFNVLDCASPRATLLFKTLFFKLDQHEGEYIEHVKRKKNASAMCNILNTMEDAEIFGQLLQENKDFAFNVLDRFNSQTTLFKTLFSQLDVKQQEDYKTHLKKRKTATAKYILENFYTTIKTAESTISSEIEGLSHINGALTETAGSTVSSKEDVFTYGDYVFTYGEMVEFIEKLSHNGTSLKDPLTSEDMEELRQAVSNVLNSREQDDGSSQSNSNSSESNIVSFAKESELDKLASNKRKRDDLLDCGEALPNSFDGNQRPAKCQCTLSCEDILELPDELLCLTTVEQWENESLQVRKW
ncbi:MAG: hypothetical protein QWI36_01830 [Wolbachia endosymbiont of Tyrophagus putrescentiae]|nr:hypothetical protein [Wolbachia endosymbiont of Tyrophagus putrescentiae]